MSSPFLHGLGSPSLNADFALMDGTFDFGMMGEQDYLKQEIECITGSDSETSTPNSPFYPAIAPIINNHQSNMTHNNNTFINNNTNTNNIIAMNNNINNNTNIHQQHPNNNNNNNNNRMDEMPSKVMGDVASGNLWAQLMMPMLAAAAAAATGGNANAAANAARQFLNIKRSESVKSQMAIERPPAPISAAPISAPVSAPPLPISSTPLPQLPNVAPFTPFVHQNNAQPFSLQSDSSSSIASSEHSSGEESMDGDGDDGPPSDLKRKRLARKAELARMSRKRKKTRMGDLEAEVDRLQKEIATLKKQIASDDAAAAAAASSSLEEDDVKKVYATIGSVIEAHSRADPHNENHSKQLLSAMDQFVHTHTRSVHQGANHLSALRPHLSPILPLHFLHWIMSQQDRFYEDPSSLWSSLFLNELRLSAEQMKDLAALRTTVKKQGKLLTDIEKGYRKLNTALKKQLTQRVENLEKIRSILTTNQLAKFLTWVNQYGPLCLQKNDGYNQTATAAASSS